MQEEDGKWLSGWFQALACVCRSGAIVKTLAVVECRDLFKMCTGMLLCILLTTLNSNLPYNDFIYPAPWLTNCGQNRDYCVYTYMKCERRSRYVSIYLISIMSPRHSSIAKPSGNRSYSTVHPKQGCTVALLPHGPTMPRWQGPTNLNTCEKMLY